MLIKFMLDKHEEKLSQSIIITFGNMIEIKNKDQKQQFPAIL